MDDQPLRVKENPLNLPCPHFKCVIFAPKGNWEFPESLNEKTLNLPYQNLRSHPDLMKTSGEPKLMAASNRWRKIMVHWGSVVKKEQVSTINPIFRGL
jgi:hypothetical protein